MRRLLGGPPKTSAKSSGSKVSVTERLVLEKMDCRVREDDLSSMDRRRGSADVNPIGILHDSSIFRRVYPVISSSFY